MHWSQVSHLPQDGSTKSQLQLQKQLQLLVLKFNQQGPAVVQPHLVARNRVPKANPNLLWQSQSQSVAEGSDRVVK